MERNLCRKGRSFYRRSDYHCNASHTQHLQLVWHCRSHDSLEVKKKKKKIESIAARGSRWRGELLFLLPEWLWEWIGSFVIRAVHSADINAQFLSSVTMERRYLLNPYLQCYKGTCPTGQESRIRIRIKAHSWLSRREDIDGHDSRSVNGGHAPEVGVYNVFTKTFCYTKSSVLNRVLFFSEGMSRCNTISWDGVWIPRH